MNYPERNRPSRTDRRTDWSCSVTFRRWDRTPQQRRGQHFMNLNTSLEVNFNLMRSINSRFTDLFYLLACYLLTGECFRA